MVYKHCGPLCETARTRRVTFLPFGGMGVPKAFPLTALQCLTPTRKQVVPALGLCGLRFNSALKNGATLAVSHCNKGWRDSSVHMSSGVADGEPMRCISRLSGPL